jgi:hypothetical protein
VNLKVEDYFQTGKRPMIRFSEKGDKETEIRVHYKLEELQFGSPGGSRQSGVFEPALVPFPSAAMRAWPISPRVKGPKNNDADLLVPAQGNDRTWLTKANRSK